jgi:hypothetical protein
MAKRKTKFQQPKNRRGLSQVANNIGNTQVTSYLTIKVQIYFSND